MKTTSKVSIPREWRKLTLKDHRELARLAYACVRGARRRGNDNARYLWYAIYHQHRAIIEASR